MDTFLSDKNRAVRRAVRSFCDQEVSPLAGEMDREAAFPWEIVEKMGKLGYFGIQVPKELGGAGLDSMSYVLVIEELSKASASLGLCVTVHNSVAVFPILAFGNDEQKQKWIPPLARGEKIGAFCLTEPNAGSDASGIEATAVRKGDRCNMRSSSDDTISFSSSFMAIILPLSVLIVVLSRYSLGILGT